MVNQEELAWRSLSEQWANTNQIGNIIQIYTGYPFISCFFLERILLEINKSTDKATIIDFIATWLPIFILNKIERNNLKEANDLFNSSYVIKFKFC